MKNSIKPYVEAKSLGVYFIVSYRGKRWQVSTGLKSSVKFEGLVFPKSETNAKAKTGRLTNLYSEIDKWMLEHSMEPIESAKEAIKAIITGRTTNEDKSLLYYMKKFAETKAKESTREVYYTTMKRIERYDKVATFDTVNRAWLENYQARELQRGREQNGIAIDLRNIRTVFNWAIDNEITDKYPFRKFSIKTEKQQYLWLNMEEMKELRDIEVEPFMEKYRDIFMLGFYLIGINISDLLELPANCIKHGRIQYKRNKTARLYDIKVEPEAMEIINKYKGEKHLIGVLDDGTKETSFRRRLNDYIKRIGKVTYVKNKQGALIKKEIQPLHPDIVWYTARRSWATIAAGLDIPKETIGKALGHSEWDNSTTDLYINFDNRKIDEANRKVLDALL
jgi:site-specific recombinase XerD